MSYSPTQVSQGDKQEFTRWLDDELRKISQAFDQVDNLAFDPLAAEPARYAEGLIIYADGSGFNPGGGAGPYYRSASTWVKMAGAAASLPTSTVELATLRADASGGWLEETLIKNDKTANTNGGQLVITGPNATSIGNESIVIDVGNSGATILSAYDDYPANTTGCSITAEFQLSNANHTMKFHMVGPSSSSQPGLELEQDGFVHLLNRAFTFGNAGFQSISCASSDLVVTAAAGVGNLFLDSGTCLGMLNQAAPNSTVGGRGQFWSRNTLNGEPCYTDSLGVTTVLNAAGGVTDHGALTGLADDDHSQYALLLGRAGGQTLIGGTGAGDDLTLVGTSGALAGARVNMNSPVEFGPYEPTGAAYGFNYDATEVFTGAFIGGGLNFSGDISFSNATFIYESFRGAPVITTNVNPGFSAYTVLQALPRFVAGAGAGHNPLSPLIVNAGPSIQNPNASARTTATCAGVNFSPTINPSVSGAVMNVTTITGLTFAPKWNTVAGARAEFGTMRGLHCQSPAVALFGGSAGIERGTAYYGVDVANITIDNAGNNMTRVALRSAMAAGTNKWFLQNVGTAHSDHAAGHMYFNDNRGIALGGLGLNYDSWIRWNGTQNVLGFQFFSTLDDFEISAPAADTFLIGSNVNTANELRFDYRKMAFGQAGAVGNQKIVFAAGAETITVGGEFAQYLLTQSANDTVDAALGLYAGWSINAPSPVIGTGSLTTGVGLNIAGNPSTAATNRVGLRILSNPSGGAGVNAALWITAGLAKLDGDLDHSGTNLGFYGTAPIAKQLAVPVTAAGVHAALVALGLIT